VDAGINLLYTSTWYKFSVLPAQEHFGAVSNAILYGPLCMNIDVLREQVTLPQMQPGDKLVISPVGAYNVTQSMQFIFHRPRVVLVSDDGTVDVIREREDLAHIERLERIPARLREQAAGTPA